MVRAAEVSRGSFYTYFDDIDDYVRVMGVRAIQDVSEIVRDLPRGADARGFAAAPLAAAVSAEVTLTSEPAGARVWIEAIEGPLREDRAAVTDWGRRRMAAMLHARELGDVEIEAEILMAIVEVFGSRRRTKAEVDACLMLIERGFLGTRRPTRASPNRPEGSETTRGEAEEAPAAAREHPAPPDRCRRRPDDHAEDDERRAPAYPKPDDITWDAVDAAGVPAEWVTPDDCEPGRAVVYLHGGGYATGTLGSTRALSSHLARATRARVLAVDYRLAPEHPFPAAVDDAVAAYRFAIAEGHAPEAIALCGDSSGGGLALATLVALRDLGDPMPGAAVCMSPWTDLTLSGASLERNRDADPMVSAATLTLMADAYLGEVDRRTPTASPLFADLRGLPPVLVQVGSNELLLDDSTRFVERAREAGVDVTLEIWDDVFHVWQAFADLLPEARDAIAHIGTYVDQRLGVAP